MKWLKQWLPLLAPAVILTGIIGYVAWRTRRIPTPTRRWKRFDHPEAVPLTASDCSALQGIYTIGEGADFFGEKAVVKYSYTVEKEFTVYHVSIFCEKNGLYALCEGRKRGNDIVLKGHWRKASAPGTGLVWLTLRGSAAGNELQEAPFLFEGTYGDDSEKPRKAFSLKFADPLPDVPPFDIIAHRGGGRNVDFLSISENTTGMVKLAAQLGANGIEIDVRMTKDDVPVIFHDSFFSIHTVQGMIYGGLLHNRTLEEVKKLELRNEGVIPTLEEMLDTVLYQTPLEIVWLDMKKECDLEEVCRLQDEYHQKAAAIDRNLTIYIGIPDKYMLDCFRKLENYKHIPSLVEMDWATAVDANAQVWAPQYTNGFLSDEVEKVHAAGKKAYVWSLDHKLMIDAYIDEGDFDGLVTNTPPVVAFWYYTGGYKVKQQTGVDSKALDVES